jgi:hypothetical protein
MNDMNMQGAHRGNRRFRGMDFAGDHIFGHGSSRTFTMGGNGSSFVF